VTRQAPLAMDAAMFRQLGHRLLDRVAYVDLGPQNSRGFRALTVWLAMRHVGANFNTSRAEVEALPEIAVRVGRDVDAHLRSIV
jgi:hypothetical protein